MHAFFSFSSLIIATQVIAIVFGSNNNDIGQCYYVASSPWQSMQDAQDWVDVYCECTAKFSACSNAAQITNLWDYIHTKDTEVVVDGYEYHNWRVHNAELIQTRHFLDYAQVTDCTMVDWQASPKRVEINETIVVAFDVPMPFLGVLNLEAFSIKSHVDITFDADGKFARKVYTSRGSAILEVLEGLQHLTTSAASIVTVVVPTSLMELVLQRAKDSESSVVIAFGCLFLLMYLSLLYVFVKIVAKCLAKSQRCCGCGRASNKNTEGGEQSQKAKTFQYKRVLDISSSAASSTAEEL